MCRRGGATSHRFVTCKRRSQLVSLREWAMFLPYSGNEREVGSRTPRERVGAASMMTLPELASDALEKFLSAYMRRRFGASQGQYYVEAVPSAARMALEVIGNSDALYHNVEHTMLVTLAGHEMLRGSGLHTHITPSHSPHV